MSSVKCCTTNQGENQNIQHRRKRGRHQISFGYFFCLRFSAKSCDVVEVRQSSMCLSTAFLQPSVEVSEYQDDCQNVIG